MSTVFVKKYLPPPVCRREILRYAGMKEETAEVGTLLDACLAEAEGVLSYRVAACSFPLSLSGDVLSLGFAEVRSASLARALSGCTGVLLFAATVGLGIDRLAMKYKSLSPARAYLLGALGSERVEALCDAFCEDLAQEVKEAGGEVRPRFSPGYGDLQLSLQKDIFRVLDCERRLGISLGESLLMTPQKSVTAIVGYKGAVL